MCACTVCVCMHLNKNVNKIEDGNTTMEYKIPKCSNFQKEICCCISHLPHMNMLLLAKQYLQFSN